MKLKKFLAIIFLVMAIGKISFAQSIDELTVNLDDKDSCRNYIAAGVHPMFTVNEKIFSCVYFSKYEKIIFIRMNTDELSRKSARPTEKF